jgi:hypothetical protein
MARPVDRYTNLFIALDEIRDRALLPEIRILEVGTYDGSRARQLLDYWGSGTHYHGFDLFDALTPEMSAAEMSKSRLPPSRAAVRARLDRVGSSISLYQGNTRETLPSVVPTLGPMDLVFVDGGHSLDTIASDWSALQPAIAPGTVVLLDDYYENRDDFGCKRLVRGLDPARFRVTLLDPVDHYDHTGLDIRMVRVELVA